MPQEPLRLIALREASAVLTGRLEALRRAEARPGADLPTLRDRRRMTRVLLRALRVEARELLGREPATVEELQPCPALAN